MGAYGLIACGLLLSGYPTPFGVDTSLLGQLGSVAVFAALGFIPGYVLAFGLKKLGMLRIPAEVELQGLDISEIPATAYPEGGMPHVPTPPAIPAATGGGAMREPATVHRQSDVRPARHDRSAQTMTTNSIDTYEGAGPVFGFGPDSLGVWIFLVLTVGLFVMFLVRMMLHEKHAYEAVINHTGPEAGPPVEAEPERPVPMPAAP